MFHVSTEKLLNIIKGTAFAIVLIKIRYIVKIVNCILVALRCLKVDHIGMLVLCWAWFTVL